MKALILVIAYPRRAVAEVEDQKMAAGAEFDLEVFPRTNDEALNDIVLPQVSHPSTGRLCRHAR
jgi:hypothetical protein